MDGPEKSTIFFSGQIFIQKKLFAVGIEAQVQNQRIFCADSPIFWDISSRIWQRIYANRTNRISPSQNRLPQFGIYRDFSQFQRKSLSFPPPKKQTKREGTRHWNTCPRQGATPKDVDGTSEVQQCIDIPWKETNEEGTRYSHYSRQSTKDPWCFWESFCFEKKSEDLFFVGGGRGVEGVEKWLCEVGCRIETGWN